MAGENDFTLISVSADDADEVVIQAGVPDGAESPDEVAEPAHEEQAVPLDAEAQRVKQSLDEAGLRVEDLDEQARAEYEQHLARSRARAQAKQMQTTADDLRAKMPFAGMQRVIVALLVVLVVAFVVYWLVGR